jgi:hypothetical protein
MMKEGYTDHQGNVQQGLVMPASFDIQESLREEPVPFSEPHQVKAFLTELTAHRGAVKTLDERLTIKSQAAARVGNTAAGFVLQTPKSAIGDRFSLDPTLMAAAGNEFYSVSDRMELVVPAEHLDRVLTVLMKEQGQSLAAFDFKDKAREFLGVRLPELEVVTDEPVREEPAPEMQKSSRPKPEAMETVEMILTVGSQPQTTGTVDVLAVTPQTRSTEKNMIRSLDQAGLRTPVLEADSTTDRDVDDLEMPHEELQVIQDEITSQNAQEQEILAVAQATANVAHQVEDLLHESQLTLEDGHPSSTSIEPTVLRNLAKPIASDEIIEQPTLFDLALLTEETLTVDNAGKFAVSDPLWAEIEHDQSKNQAIEHNRPTSSPAAPTLHPSKRDHQNQKQRYEQARNLSIEALAPQFGLERDRHDRHKWRGPGQIISIHDQKFFDHLNEQGGYGAIDFAMHVHGLKNAEAAVELLSASSLRTIPIQPPSPIHSIPSAASTLRATATECSELASGSVLSCGDTGLAIQAGRPIASTGTRLCRRSSKCGVSTPCYPRVDADIGDRCGVARH